MTLGHAIQIAVATVAIAAALAAPAAAQPDVPTAEEPYPAPLIERPSVLPDGMTEVELELQSRAIRPFDGGPADHFERAYLQMDGRHGLGSLQVAAGIAVRAVDDGGPTSAVPRVGAGVRIPLVADVFVDADAALIEPDETGLERLEPHAALAVRIPGFEGWLDGEIGAGVRHYHDLDDGDEAYVTSVEATVLSRVRIVDALAIETFVVARAPVLRGGWLDPSRHISAEGRVVYTTSRLDLYLGWAVEHTVTDAVAERLFVGIAGRLP